jgi:hypothetical protein
MMMTSTVKPWHASTHISTLTHFIFILNFVGPPIPSKSPRGSVQGSVRQSMEPPSPPESDDEDVPPPPTTAPPPTRASTVRLPVKPPSILISDTKPKAAASSADPSGEIVNQGLKLNNIPNFSSATRSSLSASLFGTEDNKIKSVISDLAGPKPRSSMVGDGQNIEVSQVKV